MFVPGMSGNIVNVDRQDHPEVPTWDPDHPRPHPANDQVIRFLVKYRSTQHEA